MPEGRSEERSRDLRRSDSQDRIKQRNGRQLSTVVSYRTPFLMATWRLSRKRFIPAMKFQTVDVEAIDDGARPLLDGEVPIALIEGIELEISGGASPKAHPPGRAWCRR